MPSVDTSLPASEKPAQTQTLPLGAAARIHCEDTGVQYQSAAIFGSIPDAIFRLMSPDPQRPFAPTIMAAPMPPLAPHNCTRGSAYGCTAAAANGTSDDCTGDRPAAHRTHMRFLLRS